MRVFLYRGKGMDHEIKVKSLQKAMEVLNCFTEKPCLGVTEISEKLGLYKSNVHNILNTFAAMGYVQQDTVDFDTSARKK